MKGQAFPALVEAVHQDLITEAEIDTAAPPPLPRPLRARHVRSAVQLRLRPDSLQRSQLRRSIASFRCRPRASRWSCSKTTDHILPLKSGYRQHRRHRAHGRARPVAAGQLQRAAAQSRLSAQWHREALRPRARSATRRDRRWSKASPCRSSTPRCIPSSGAGDGLTGEYFNSRPQRQARAHPHRPQHQLQLG